MGGWITRRAALWAPGSLGGTGLDEAPAAIRSNSDTLRLQLRRGCDEGKVGVHGGRAALDVRASRYERVGQDCIGRRATGDGRMRGASGTSSVVERTISPPAESSQPGNFLAGAVIELGEGVLVGASSSESRRGRKAIWTQVPAGPLARCQTQIIGVSTRSVGPDGDSPWRCRPTLSSLTLCLRTRRGRLPPPESCLPRLPPRLALDSSTLSHVPDTCSASHTPSIQLRQS